MQSVLRRATPAVACSTLGVMESVPSTETTPRPLRGPFTRWPRAADAVLALVVFLGAIINVTTQDAEDSQNVSIDLVADLSVGAYLLLGLGAAAVYWRRLHPLVVLVTAVGASVAYADILKSVKRHVPEAKIDGILVEDGA